MRCPVDGTTLALSERNGVEIDYCPECRGIWLDRGELDRIIDHATGRGPRGDDRYRHHDDDRRDQDQDRRYREHDDDERGIAVRSSGGTEHLSAAYVQIRKA